VLANQSGLKNLARMTIRVNRSPDDHPGLEKDIGDPEFPHDMRATFCVDDCNCY
jgi:hypothetical protein